MDVDSTNLRLIASSSVVCSALHLFARVAVSRLGSSDLSRGDRLYLAELLPSSVHAIVTAGSASYLVLSGAWKRDLVKPYPFPLKGVLAFSAGYSLHDMAVMALHGEPLSMW